MRSQKCKEIDSGTALNILTKKFSNTVIVISESIILWTEQIQSLLSEYNFVNINTNQQVLIKITEIFVEKNMCVKIRKLRFDWNIYTEYIQN